MELTLSDYKISKTKKINLKIELWQLEVVIYNRKTLDGISSAHLLKNHCAKKGVNINLFPLSYDDEDYLDKNLEFFKGKNVIMVDISAVNFIPLCDVCLSLYIIDNDLEVSSDFDFFDFTYYQFGISCLKMIHDYIEDPYHELFTKIINSIIIEDYENLTEIEKKVGFGYKTIFENTCCEEYTFPENFNNELYVNFKKFINKDELFLRQTISEGKKYLNDQNKITTAAKSIKDIKINHVEFNTCRKPGIYKVVFLKANDYNREDLIKSINKFVCVDYIVLLVEDSDIIIQKTNSLCKLNLIINEIKSSEDPIDFKKELPCYLFKYFKVLY